METDAMWRVVGDQGRRLEAVAEDLQAIARRSDLEAFRVKLREIHAVTRQCDAVFAALDQ